MQRIVNLLLIQDQQVLLLKKPRRGWYVAPGGKMDTGESILETAIRECREETGVTPLRPHLKGVYTIMMMDDKGQQLQNEWMLYTFIAKDFEGTPMSETREGILEWHPLDQLKTLPMAEGDRLNLMYAVQKSGIQYGTFYYTDAFQLLNAQLQHSTEGDEMDGTRNTSSRC